MIKDNITVFYKFRFESLSLDDILKVITNLNSAKNCTFKNIPIRCLKEVVDFCSPSLIQIWSNEIIKKKPFPTSLKLADATPVFKKIDSTLAENYRSYWFYLRYQRCLRNSCKNSLIIISTNSYHHFYVATEKGTVHNLH